MTVPVEPGQTLIAALRRVPLFERLDDATLREISRAMRPLAVPAGTFVMRQGDPGDAFYVIESGEAQVFVGDDTNPVELARLGAGRYVGEGALVTGEPRSASVVALQDSTLLVLDAADFRRLVDHYPAFRTAVQRVAEARAAGSHVFENEAYELLALENREAPVRLGRDATNDIVLDLPGVDAHHAEVRWADGAVQITDLGSAAGTYVNGDAVREARLSEGDVVWLGAARLFLHDGSLRLFQPSRGVRLDARGLGRTVGRKVILEDVDLTFYPGEMVAVVGPSGAGKTTLLHLLLGFNRPTAGTVLYDGVPLANQGEAVRSMLGFVPQQDIVHPELTARECLEAAARLRADSGAEATRLRGRIDSVLREVRLDQQADQRVARLSGGQRKRASCAVELLTEPRILFLDEPTSGLDPALDDQMMHLFRALADAGRTVVLTTHATRNLRICDRVVVVSGGRLVFTGTPSEALDYFQVEDFSEIYAPLLQAEAAELVARFEASPTYERQHDSRIDQVPEPQTAVAAPRQPWRARQATVARQFVALALRDLQVILRDRLNLALRILGPPLMAGALLLTFESTIFAESAKQGGNVREAITLLYLGASISLFLSAITSSNAITREDAIYRRERVVSLSPLAYAGSKVFWVAVTSLIQGTLVALVLAAGVEFPDPMPKTLLLVAAAMSLTAAAGGALGLFVSSVSPNSDRAAILAVLLMIPQLIFAGSTVPRAEMELPALVISDLTISKWTLELLSDITNIDRRLLLQSVVTVNGGEFIGTFDVRIETPFDNAFKIQPAWRWLVLLGWFTLFSVAMWAVQAAKGRRR